MTQDKKSTSQAIFWGSLKRGDMFHGNPWEDSTQRVSDELVSPHDRANFMRQGCRKPKQWVQVK